MTSNPPFEKWPENLNFSEAHCMGWAAAVLEPVRKNPFISGYARREWDAGYDARTQLESELADADRRAS